METASPHKPDSVAHRSIRFGERRAGWVADYCAICRDVQSHALVRKRKSPNGFVPLVAVCDVCGVRYETTADRYVAIAAKNTGSIADLMLKTFPRLPLVAYRRARFDLDAINGRLPPPERVGAIREGVLLMSYLVPKTRSWLFLPCVWLATIIVCVATTGLVPDPVSKNVGALQLIMMFAILVGPVGVVVTVWWYPRWVYVRARRNVMIPAFARSIRPLRPTLEEIEDVHAWLVATGNPMSKDFNPAKVFDRIRVARDESMTHVHELDFFREASRMQAELAALTEPDQGPLVGDGDDPQDDQDVDTGT